MTPSSGFADQTDTPDGGALGQPLARFAAAEQQQPREGRIEQRPAVAAAPALHVLHSVLLQPSALLFMNSDHLP